MADSDVDDSDVDDSDVDDSDVDDSDVDDSDVADRDMDDSDVDDSDVDDSDVDDSDVDDVENAATSPAAGSAWHDTTFVLCDLDGVVWLARRAIPGAADAIARLRSSGRRVLFVTNNSMSVIADQEAALADIGVPAVGDVVTSAQAGASLVQAGETVLVAGAAGLAEAVAARGATVVSEGPADAVIVGLHHDFDYARLHAASAAVRDGARFIATNDDASFPTPDGLTPGAGAIVAAVATAAGSTPIVAGKPHEPMARLVADRCGPDFLATAAVVIGDRASTDGRFAAAIGCPFALVRSGVTGPDDPLDADVAVDLDIADLAAAVPRLLER